MKTVRIETAYTPGTAKNGKQYQELLAHKAESVNKGDLVEFWSYQPEQKPARQRFGNEAAPACYVVNTAKVDGLGKAYESDGAEWVRLYITEESGYRTEPA